MFMQWVETVLPEESENLTLSIDGKTIRSTNKMGNYKTPLHIVSAFISEMGMTFGQKKCRRKKQ